MNRFLIGLLGAFALATASSASAAPSALTDGAQVQPVQYARDAYNRPIYRPRAHYRHGRHFRHHHAYRGYHARRY